MSINGTLAFVILWIVNALISLVYLLVGIFLYVPACDLKRDLQDGIPPGGRSGRCYFQQGTCADTSESGRGAGAQHGAAGRIACRQ